jgi:hypothetical protein
VEVPVAVALRSVLDGLAHELDAETAAPVLGQDEDVREPGDDLLVGHDPAEADQRVAVVGADHPAGPADQPLDGLA